MDQSIKIYVICHKETYIPKEQNLYPIQVGTSISNKVLPGIIHDNEGENISDLNPDYCELTGIYWAWKNDNSDYVGIFHYRRFLILNENKNFKKYDWWKHFYNFTTLTDNVCKKIGFDGNENELISKYDLIIPYPSEFEYRGIKSFYDSYSAYFNELDYTFKIVKELYPDYEKALLECKNGKLGYHCNMFIMKRSMYEEYCTFLFTVVNKVYDDIKKGLLITNKKRLIGYLAEFLTGVFFIYTEKKMGGSTTIKKVPGVFFKYTDGKKHTFETYLNSLINIIRNRLILPKGSKRAILFYFIIDAIRKRK